MPKGAANQLPGVTTRPTNIPAPDVMKNSSQYLIPPLTSDALMSQRLLFEMNTYSKRCAKVRGYTFAYIRCLYWYRTMTENPRLKLISENTACAIPSKIPPKPFVGDFFRLKDAVLDFFCKQKV